MNCHLSFSLSYFLHSGFFLRPSQPTSTNNQYSEPLKKNERKKKPIFFFHFAHKRYPAFCQDSLFGQVTKLRWTDVPRINGLRFFLKFSVNTVPSSVAEGERCNYSWIISGNRALFTHARNCIFFSFWFLSPIESPLLVSFHSWFFRWNPWPTIKSMTGHVWSTLLRRVFLIVSLCLGKKKKPIDWIKSEGASFFLRSQRRQVLVHRKQKKIPPKLLQIVTREFLTTAEDSTTSFVSLFVLIFCPRMEYPIEILFIIADHVWLCDGLSNHYSYG